MIARIEFNYDCRPKLVDLAKSDEIYARLKEMLTDCPDDERKGDPWSWHREQLIDLETDGRWLLDHDIHFEVKRFKGTMPLTSIAQDGSVHNVYVQVPHVGLLAINEVEVCEDFCTDQLQRKLDEGWRIICVCPPNAARRPDYIPLAARRRRHEHPHGQPRHERPRHRQMAQPRCALALQVGTPEGAQGRQRIEGEESSMITFGTRVRSKRNGARGVVVGYGAIQWPDDDRMQPVFLVQIAHGSSCLGAACAVFLVDQTEEEK